MIRAQSIIKYENPAVFYLQKALQIINTFSFSVQVIEDCHKSYRSHSVGSGTQPRMIDLISEVNLCACCTHKTQVRSG